MTGVLNLEAASAEFDVIVVGSGCAGLATALFASIKGLKVCVLESTEYIGGTTAFSAGALWLPNSEVGKTVNPNDSVENTTTFLAEATAGRSTDMQAQFIKTAPAAVACLQSETEVKLRAFPHHPDYLSELPGATLNGRILEALPFDGRQLGDDFKRIRPPIPEFTIFGGMMVNRVDIGHLLGMKRSLRSLLYSIGLVSRYLLDRITYRRGTRLVMGNALVGRLVRSLQKRSVPIYTSVRVKSLQMDYGRVSGVSVELDDKEVIISARRGVVSATGGFNRNAALREKLIGKAVEYSPTAPGGTGLFLDEILRHGGKLEASANQQAFWAPVSIATRQDGTEAVFPHFVLDRAKPGTMIVNQDGRRYADESVSYHAFGSSMLELGAGSNRIPSYLIADSTAFLKYGLGMVRPGGMGKQKFVENGYLTEAESVEDLARKLEVCPENLATSVRKMNEHADKGVDTEFGRGQTRYAHNLGDPAMKPNPNLGRLEAAPFYAVRLYPGDIGAVAGLVVDHDARVMGPHFPIPGLYAVGNDMKSIMDGAYPGPGITLGPGVVFAYLAAEALARERNEPRAG